MSEFGCAPCTRPAIIDADPIRARAQPASCDGGARPLISKCGGQGSYKLKKEKLRSVVRTSANGLCFTDLRWIGLKCSKGRYGADFSTVPSAPVEEAGRAA